MRYPGVGCGLTAAPEAQQSLKGGHWFLSAIVSKHELIKVDLEMAATHTVVSTYEQRL